jgi:hypothetical protein
LAEERELVAGAVAAYNLHDPYGLSPRAASR